MAHQDLGTRIKRARERRGWSQQEVADRLTAQRGGRTVGVRSVGRWERGESVPRNAIGALEVVLGLDFSEDAPDPNEQEIRELGARLGLAPGDQDAWIEIYRRRPPPAGERPTRAAV